MNLIPVTRQELDTGVVFADAERRQLIGVMTGTAARKDTSTDIRAAGVVAYAEPRLHDLTLRYQGWIGELFANSQGMEVAKGQPLFTLYSPELLTAQNEYLQGRSAAPGESSLRDATRQRLELWGMTPQQIVELDRRGSAQTYVPILSPVRGIIVDKEVVAGSAVQAGKLVLRIADLSEVWVEAALYEYEQASIRLGMPVTVTFDAYPGASWAGKISFLYPYMDVQTRSTRARITLANADRRLKPGMYATAQVHVPLGTRLVVPESAVIHAGATALVFLDLGEGKLKPQHVTTGILTNDGIEILSGLVPGDTVVTKATFLLAAESRLKSGAASW
jgi:Cu(I)/Ag(I) efflux system membrane fusion protein